MQKYDASLDPEISFYMRLVDHVTGQAVEVVGTAESFEVSGDGFYPSHDVPPWDATMKKMKILGFMLAINPDALPDRTLKGVTFPSADEIASGHAAS